MAAGSSIDVSGWLEEQLAQASPDLLRAMVTTFAEALIGAEADAVCGAAYGERNTERTNTRNGYRRRDWDTRAGSISLATPKLRQGSYFPDWLLERRRRAEAALVTVGATSYLLGVSTRRMEKLVETLGITRLSKSQVSEMAGDLDAQVEAFRTRPLDASRPGRWGHRRSSQRLFVHRRDDSVEDGVEVFDLLDRLPDQLGRGHLTTPTSSACATASSPAISMAGLVVVTARSRPRRGRRRAGPATQAGTAGRDNHVRRREPPGLRRSDRR